MTEEQRRRLKSIKTFADLIDYLSDELGWPIEQGQDEDDLTFDWSDDLGLKESERVGIKEIKQLRPLETGQPWGIFFVNFDKKRLPIVILRRILNSLVIKKRADATKGQQAAWKQHDLLFISAFGEDSDRQLTFAHFSEPAEEENTDKATLRVLGWDDDDTNLKLDHVADQLKSSLTWPANPRDIPAWHRRWSAAFELRHRQVIETAEELALHLAELAKRIRNRMLQVLPLESPKGELQRLLKGFQTALIHDLDEQQFSDMYAQTITYGLFSAAVSRTVPGAGTAVAQANVVDMVPVTNPFLKEMLTSFLKAGGSRNKLDFDELGIQEVVDLLNDKKTNLAAVLRDFGNKTRGEDPVIHFYEQFLAAYDKELKVQRGVFYTPQPVVSYIVRSVHEVLQTQFGLEDGLAAITTWGEMLKKHKNLKLPPLSDDPGEERTISADEPFVQILDPATGTATFLVEVIDVIHQTMTAKWAKKGMTAEALRNAWNDYVPNYLLPRLHAFELMMAPYAIAHMKLGLKLYETGYRFGSDERARIYLTNALEPKVQQLPFIDFNALAREAAAVNEIKWHKRFTVILGNPPYSRSSSNKGAFIEQLMDTYKHAVRDERNLQPLSDDYIKFFRYSQHQLGTTRAGVMGLITNNTFLSGRIHRGMRQSLIRSFASRQVVNLHGSGKVKLLATVGMRDENVFDILQGVSISVLSTIGSPPLQTHSELIGPREQKYSRLLNPDALERTLIEPFTPYFLWIPRTSNTTHEYERFAPLDKLFRFHSVSGKPGDDSIFVSIDKKEALRNLVTFREKHNDSASTKLTEAGRKIVSRPFDEPFDSARVEPYAYRPFDTRFTYYDSTLWTRAVRPLKACIDGSPVLLSTKIVKDATFSHAFVTRLFADVIFLSNTSSVNCYSFPTKVVVERRGLLGDVESDYNLDMQLFRGRLGGSVEADTAFEYIYAILYSPSYRRRYFEALQYEFPRIPLTGSPDLFIQLAQLGRDLIALHMLESPTLDQCLTEFTGDRRAIAKVGYTDTTVWIDLGGTKEMPRPGTSGFRGVPSAVWNFHIGGYQVCEKWLKDRQGRMLSADDIHHYQRIIAALSETIRLMDVIDRVIDEQGGWPDAFLPSSPEQS